MPTPKRKKVARAQERVIKGWAVINADNAEITCWNFHPGGWFNIHHLFMGIFQERKQAVRFINDWDGRYGMPMKVVPITIHLPKSKGKKIK